MAAAAHGGYSTRLTTVINSTRGPGKPWPRRPARVALPDSDDEGGMLRCIMVRCLDVLLLRNDLASLRRAWCRQVVETAFEN
jgi:hypothetical protein